LIPQRGRLNRRNPHADPVWDQSPFRLQETSARISEVLEDAGVEAETADLIGDDHVDPLWQLRIERQFLDERDTVVVTVGAAHLARDLDHAAGVDRVHAAGSGATREQTQDSSSGPKVEHDVAGAYHLGDGGGVGGHSRGVGEVLTMFVED
jgi:hypothetical protein